MPSGAFLLSLINGLGIFALIAIAYGHLLQSMSSTLLRELILGLAFGLCASLAMANSADFVPGLKIDARVVPLILAAPFSGIAGALVAGATTSIIRLWIGGVGAGPGVLNIAVAVGIGIAASILWRGERGLRTNKLLLLGLLANLPFLCLFLVPLPDRAAYFFRVIGPLSIAHLFGVWVLGKFLAAEQRDHARKLRLVNEANFDPLTRLANRRHFGNRFQKETSRAAESGQCISVIILDIDHFKLINDTFGHDTGDAVLVWLADMIRDHLREGDLAARFGGEEFILSLTGPCLSLAALRAEELRKHIEEAGCIAGSDHHFTASFGIAGARGGEASFEELYASADRALYAAKSSGRNCVRVATDTASVPIPPEQVPFRPGGRAARRIAIRPMEKVKQAS